MSHLPHIIISSLSNPSFQLTIMMIFFLQSSNKQKSLLSDLALSIPQILKIIHFDRYLYDERAVKGGKGIYGVKLIGIGLLCFRMETYNELLRQFHDEAAPKDFLQHYKTLLDDLHLASDRKKHHLLLKTAELRNMQTQGQASSLTLSSISLSFSGQSQLACSRLDEESAGQLQLRRELTELERVIEALRTKTVDINSELNIYRNKETLVSDTGLGSGFSVLRQWKEVEQEANQMSREELRQEQMLHDLKARKEKLSQEIQQLMKNKQATDQLLKRWRKSKLTRINTFKEPQGNTDLHDILRAFHFLAALAQEYSNNTGVSCQDLKNRYDWHDDFKGNKAELMRMYQQKGNYYGQQAATKLICFYQQLEVELDRNQRAHHQATETLRTLESTHEKLKENLQNIHERKERYTIHALRKYSMDIQALELKLAGTCDRITQLATALYEQLRRVSSFFKGAEHVMEKSKAGRRLLRELPDCDLLKHFQELLFKNPQEQLLEWSSHQLYTQISSNSLLRLYASPKGLSPQLDALDNYDKITAGAFKLAQQYPKEMLRLISQYLRLAGSGPKNNQSILPEQGYCVESKQYYRRDNFRLLERLENEQLRRKGLLIRIPINLVADSEMAEPERGSPLASTSSFTPRPSFSTGNLKYTDIASKRQQHSLRKQKIRKLFGKLESVNRLGSVSRSDRRFPLNTTLDCSRMNIKQDSSTLCLQGRVGRRTVGTFNRLNCSNDGLT